MIKVSRMQVVALAALLVSCGGGDSVQTAAGPQAATPASRAAVSAATPVEAANQLMDWAEAQLQYQGYFPEHQASLSDVPPFLYRHYSSGVYLGVVTSDNATYPLGGVYVLGAVFGGMLKVGQVSDFTVTPPAPGPSAAASCPAFTGGTYRFIKPAPAGQESVVTLATVVIDGAGTPKLGLPGSPARTLTAGAAPCSFTLPDGSGLAVTPASVALVSSVEGSNRYPGLLFPEQTIAVPDLAGTWNRLGWGRRDPGGFGQPYELDYGTLTLTAAGAVTTGQNCSVAADLSGGCITSSVNGGIVAEPSGGYSGTGDLSGARLFAYKHGTDTMVVTVDPDGSLALLTPPTTVAPTLGTRTSVLNMVANTAGVVAVAGTNAIPGLSTVVNTITSVDTVSGVVVRTSTQDGGAPATQTLHLDAPLPGFRKRDAASGVSAAILLPVRGMGLAAGARLGATTATTPGTGNGFLAMSADQP